MSLGLNKEIHRLTKVAKPLIDHIDLLSPTADALIDGTSGHSRTWKWYGYGAYSFLGQKNNDPHNELIVSVEPQGLSYIQSKETKPIHQLWEIDNMRRPSSITRYSGNLSEIAARAIVRDLRQTLEKILINQPVNHA